MVVKGDPAARIADIENVEIVFKDGVGSDTAKLLESVRGRNGEVLEEPRIVRGLRAARRQKGHTRSMIPLVA